MDVGLVLLRHRILDVDKPLQRALNIGFVREGLGDHHDEATLDQLIGPQVVAVEGFTGITDKNEPRERPVSSHFFVLTVKHGRINHSNFWRKRATEIKFSPADGKISPLMRRLKGGLLLKQGKSRRRPQGEDNQADQREVQTLHADPLPPSRVRESKSLLFHA